jgi:hypothetical protein
MLCICRDRLTNSSGGSSDTDVNEFAVTPTGIPSSAVVVTIVTPVAKQPNIRRNAMGFGARRVAIIR